MTNVITRYFESAGQARAVKHELVHRRGLSAGIVDLFQTADGLAETLTKAHVSADTAQAYQQRVARGGAVLLVRATYKPLGVAQTTRDVTAQMGAVALAGLSEETYVKDGPRTSNSVLRDHPLMLSRRKDPDSTNFHMADWPLPLIIRRAPFTDDARPFHGPITAMFFPLTIETERFTKSIFPRHGRMADWPIPLISHRKPNTASIFGRHARMANFPIPLISRRKPFTGSLVPTHGRMATWPFPLLINGKTGQNALMPGGPRMANFPIGLLSRRKPFTGSIFGRHARMASFPFGLISRRKPFTGSIVSPHGRMANFILPLIIRRSDTAPVPGKGFSLSRFLGLPTLIRR